MSPYVKQILTRLHATLWWLVIVITISAFAFGYVATANAYRFALEHVGEMRGESEQKYAELLSGMNSDKLYQEQKESNEAWYRVQKDDLYRPPMTKEAKLVKRWQHFVDKEIARRKKDNYISYNLSFGATLLCIFLVAHFLLKAWLVWVFRRPTTLVN